MRYLKRKYETPSRPFDKQRIEEERKIVNNFGLKNKKELWRAESNLRKFRRLARKFAASPNPQEEKLIFDKLYRMGILTQEAVLDDILILTVSDFLERRLQTVLERKGISNTVKNARQMIVHGHVKIHDRKITYPSYLVSREEESKINIYLTAKNKIQTNNKPTTVKEIEIEEKKE